MPRKGSVFFSNIILLLAISLHFIQNVYILSNKFGLLTPNLFNISDINVSNTCDSIPVFPILPTSSLSDNIHTAVFSGTFVSNGVNPSGLFDFVVFIYYALSYKAMDKEIVLLENIKFETNKTKETLVFKLSLLKSLFILSLLLL